MRRITLRGLLARKLRLALTALAIVLGRDVRDRDARARRHAQSHVQQPDRRRLPARQLRGSRQGGVRREHSAERHRDGGPQARARVDRRARSAACPAIAVRVRYRSAATPSSSSRDGSSIDDGAGKNLGFAFDPNRQLSAFRLVAGRAPVTSHDVVIDKDTATKYHFVVGDPCASCCPDGNSHVHGQRHRDVRGRQHAGRRHAGRLLADDRPGAVRFAGPLRRDQRAGRVRRRQRRAATAIARLLPAGVEVVSGQAVANQLSQRRRQRTLVPVDRAADLRADLAARRRLHDLQHVHDHHRSAHPRAGAAARGRRESPPAVRLGAGRGDDPRARRVADRAGARCGGRARPEGIAEGVRDQLALGTARVRGAHRGSSRLAWEWE